MRPNRPAVPAALLAALAVLGALSGCTHRTVRTAAPEPSPTAAASPTAEPSPPPAPSSSPASPTPALRTTARTVFWLGPGPRPRLYRESVPRPVTTGVIADAVRTMLGTRPADPDLRTLWPAGTRLLGASLAGPTATLDLSREALAGPQDRASAQASLQQLVRTVVAAAPGVQTVSLRVAGQAVPTLWGQDVRALTARPDALADVWLLVPEGATLRRGARFGGEATVFEGTVSWSWTQGGTTVARGASQASEGAPGRGTWSAVVQVPPGRYELRAYEESAEDGRPLAVDSKHVTVA